MDGWISARFDHLCNEISRFSRIRENRLMK